MSTHTHTQQAQCRLKVFLPPDCFDLQLALGCLFFFRMLLYREGGGGETSCVPVVDIATPAVGLLINTANTLQHTVQQAFKIIKFLIKCEKSLPFWLRFLELK